MARVKLPWNEILFKQSLSGGVDRCRDDLLRRRVVVAIVSLLQDEEVKILVRRHLLWLGQCYLWGTIIDELDCAIHEQRIFSRRHT